jgi:hypothetical protein
MSFWVGSAILLEEIGSGRHQPTYGGSIGVR